MVLEEEKMIREARRMDFSKYKKWSETKASHDHHHIAARFLLPPAYPSPPLYVVVRRSVEPTTINHRSSWFFYTSTKNAFSEGLEGLLIVSPTGTTAVEGLSGGCGL